MSHLGWQRREGETLGHRGQSVNTEPAARRYVVHRAAQKASVFLDLGVVRQAQTWAPATSMFEKSAKKGCPVPLGDYHTTEGHQAPLGGGGMPGPCQGPG